MTIQVGSVVRAPRAGTKQKGRAVVATLPDEDDLVCILWEDMAPRPLDQRRFVVTPMVPCNKEELEDTVCQSLLSPLLDFEEEFKKETIVAVCKDHGDALLRLGDASAAIPYYEAGLSASSILQVGSTVLVSEEDKFQVAEVDCLEDDNVDVTMGKEEATIPASNVKLCFLHGQVSLQVRILLNLTRCLMQVAELDGTTMSAYYRCSASTACSMALTMLETMEGESSLHATALLLRSKAYASRGKWALAMQDAQSLISKYPGHKEGRTWMPQLESEMTRQQKTNQKLAKAMCQWIQTATTTAEKTETTNTDEKQQRESGTIAPLSSVSRVPAQGKLPSAPPNRSQSSFTMWCQLLVPLLLALWIHQLLSRYNISQDSKG